MEILVRKICVKPQLGITYNRAVELLRGVRDCFKDSAIDYYVLKNNSIVSIKFSHIYDGVGYWFGITSKIVKY